MRLSRSLRALTSSLALLALLAMLMMAFAPTISRALDAQGTPYGFEVCSAAGFKTQLPGDDAPRPDGKHLFEHCPYCSLHADDLALPSAPLALALPIACSEALVQPALDPPQTSAAWTQAQPRAPPLAF